MGNKTSSGKINPEIVTDLLENTNFSEPEIRRWFKDFRKDFPSGQVTIQQFKEIYSEHFPHGDATKFAEHVFRTFDRDHDHMLDFREFLVAVSVTAKGEAKDRLRWAFNMYDADENGFISRAECVEIIKAIHNLTDAAISGQPDYLTPEERTEQIFRDLDFDQDGRLTEAEFLAGCTKNAFLMKMMQLEPGWDRF